MRCCVTFSLIGGIGTEQRIKSNCQWLSKNVICFIKSAAFLWEIAALFYSTEKPVHFIHFHKITNIAYFTSPVKSRDIAV